MLVRDTDLRIITDMSDFLDLEKSKMISSAIFLALPYGFIGNWTKGSVNNFRKRNIFKVYMP